MPFDLHALVKEKQGQARRLHEQYGNTVFTQVLEMIGFDHEYAEGEGSYLTTTEDRRVFDGLSGYGVFGLGRNHPVIKQAIADALDHNFPNLVQMDCSLLSGMLAERLIQIAPGDRLQHVFFTNSGAEAVEGAIKFARAAANRPRILYSKGAFHGLSTGSLALNGDESFREGFGDLLPGCQAIDPEDLDALKHELKKGDVAAVMLEPIRGKGVFYPKDDSIFPAIQRLCHEHDVLFVIDEIQTGLGRTGKRWASEHWDLKPDMLVTAKLLSGGMVPVGAILHSETIYRQVFSRLDRCVVHSSTFGQNALAMVAGLATLQVIEDEDLVNRCAQQGEKLRAGLQGLESKHEFVREVRGKGLMIGIEFGAPRSLRLKPAYSLLHAAQKGLFAQAIVMQLYRNHNLLTQVSGHNQEIVKLLPPYAITDAEIEHIINAFDAELQECQRFPGPVWSVGKQLAGAAARQRFAARS